MLDMATDPPYGVKPYGVKPYLPPPPPNNGLGMGADATSANGDRMGTLGTYHLTHTQTLERVGGPAGSRWTPTEARWFWWIVAAILVVVILKFVIFN
jgi:hypothetical protein